MTSAKFDLVPFDGKTNFSIWQSTAKDMLVQHGLYKALLDKKPDDKKDDDWKELQAKTVSMIRLSLVPEIKYTVLNETSPVKLWEKLENLYMSKSLTNKLYLKKELFELKMQEGSDVSSHMNKFNKCITQLLSVEIEIDEEDQAIILLASLPKSYETLVTTLLVGKQTLTVDEVTTAILETEKIKQPNSSSEAESLAMKDVKEDISK